MSIGKTISIKISNYNLSTEEFVEIIEKINNSNNIHLTESPLDYAWGYQNDDNLRINFFRSKQKVEFVLIYENYEEIEQYISMIKSFIKFAKLDFKFISLSFGMVYIDYPDISYKFIVPEFTENDKLKYKLSTEIHNIESGEVYLSANFHFYDFLKMNKNPKDTIMNDIIGKFKTYYDLFNKMVEC